MHVNTVQQVALDGIHYLDKKEEVCGVFTLFQQAVPALHSFQVTHTCKPIGEEEREAEVR